MPMVKIKSPVVVFWEGAYRLAGTLIELEEVEARHFIELHGQLGPDEEITNSLEDIQSVAALNEAAAIHGGTGHGS